MKQPVILQTIWLFYHNSLITHNFVRKTIYTTYLYLETFDQHTFSTNRRPQPKFLMGFSIHSWVLLLPYCKKFAFILFWHSASLLAPTNVHHTTSIKALPICIKLSTVNFCQNPLTTIPLVQSHNIELWRTPKNHCEVIEPQSSCVEPFCTLQNLYSFDGTFRLHVSPPRTQGSKL